MNIRLIYLFTTLKYRITRQTNDLPRDYDILVFSLFYGDSYRRSTVCFFPSIVLLYNESDYNQNLFTVGGSILVN